MKIRLNFQGFSENHADQEDMMGKPLILIVGRLRLATELAIRLAEKLNGEILRRSRLFIAAWITAKPSRWWHVSHTINRYRQSR